MKLGSKCWGVVASFGLAVLLFSAPAIAKERMHTSQKSTEQSSTATTHETHSSGAIDINTATRKQLERLPGIGRSTAKKIIAARPYTSVDELSTKAGLSQKEMDKIRDRVTVGSSSETAATSTEHHRGMTERKEHRGAGNASSRSESSSTSANASAQTPPAPGMVWVNEDTKVYHREGDRWYGKTKHGRYMTEQEAQKEGYRAAKEGGKEK